jgi:hypothetical protein
MNGKQRNAENDERTENRSHYIIARILIVDARRAHAGRFYLLYVRCNYSRELRRPKWGWENCCRAAIRNRAPVAGNPKNTAPNGRDGLLEGVVRCLGAGPAGFLPNASTLLAYHRPRCDARRSIHDGAGGDSGAEV